MSRSVHLAEFADPIPFEFIDSPEQHAAAGQLRIRVSAAGINPIDWKIAAIPGLGAHFGVAAPDGFGSDFAGVVDEVGDGVEGFAVGDRVFGGARGRAAADVLIATLATDRVRHTPDGLDDVTAGALDIAGRTAVAALTAAAVGAGDTVLIGGAAGGVGVVAVQLARAAGATVIATASEPNHEFLRELGAIPVTYGDGLADRVHAASAAAVTAAIDLAGVETVHAALELGVAPERIATIAAGPTPPGGAVPTGSGAVDPEVLDAIAASLASGALVLPIAATFPLEQIADAVALQRTGHVRGKVVVTVGH